MAMGKGIPIHPYPFSPIGDNNFIVEGKCK